MSGASDSTSIHRFETLLNECGAINTVDSGFHLVSHVNALPECFNARNGVAELSRKNELSGNRTSQRTVARAARVQLLCCDCASTRGASIPKSTRVLIAIAGYIMVAVDILLSACSLSCFVSTRRNTTDVTPNQRIWLHGTVRDAA